MRMSWMRFLFLDTLGILIVSPTFVCLGYYLGDVIDSAVKHIMQVERGLKFTLLGAGVLGVLWWWMRRRRRKRLLLRGPQEAFVEPSVKPKAAAPDSELTPKKDASTAEAPGEGDEGRVIPGPGSKGEEPDGGNVNSH